MKLSCFEMLVGERPYAESFAMIAEAGFDGVDLRGDKLAGRVDEARAAAAESGLEIASVYGSHGALLAAAVADRAAAVDVVHTRLADAEAVGTHRLVSVPIFGGPQIRSDLGQGVEAVEWAVLAVLLEELVPDATDRQVAIVVEPLNSRETHLVRSPTTAAEFIRRWESPWLRTMIDTYHADLEQQEAVAEVTAAADQLGIVHLSDRNRTLPGQGGIDFPAILAALGLVGYDGFGGSSAAAPSRWSSWRPACVMSAR